MVCRTHRRRSEGSGSSSAWGLAGRDSSCPPLRGRLRGETLIRASLLCSRPYLWWRSLLRGGPKRRTWLPTSFLTSARVPILVSLVGAVTGCEQQPVTAERSRYMTAAERVTYIRDFEPSCLVNLGTGALSRLLSGEQRAQYCSCAAVRSSETITLEEMGMWVRTGDRERVRPHLAAVDNYCSEKLIPLWLLETPRAAAASSRMPPKTRTEKARHKIRGTAGAMAAKSRGAKDALAAFR